MILKRIGQLSSQSLAGRSCSFKLRGTCLCYLEAVLHGLPGVCTPPLPSAGGLFSSAGHPRPQPSKCGSGQTDVAVRTPWGPGIPGTDGSAAGLGQPPEGQSASGHLPSSGSLSGCCTFHPGLSLGICLFLWSLQSMTAGMAFSTCGALPVGVEWQDHGFVIAECCSVPDPACHLYGSYSPHESLGGQALLAGEQPGALLGRGGDRCESPPWCPVPPR